MKLAQLSETVLSKIKTVRWDLIIEKHEGPQDWESVLRYSSPEFMEDDDPFFSGFLAVCDRLVGENFYLAVVYHEWFVIDNPLTAGAKTEP